MVRLLTDENFNGDIVRGLLLRRPALDLVRVVEVGLAGVEDQPAALAGDRRPLRDPRQAGRHAWAGLRGTRRNALSPVRHRGAGLAPELPIL